MQDSGPDRSPLAARCWSHGRVCGPRGRILMLLGLIVFAAVAPFGPTAPARAATCGCDKTGPYVDPGVAAPAIVKAKDGAASPNNVYAVRAQVSGSSVSITVTNTQSHATVLTQQVSGDVHWYFSSDDDRFVLDVLASQQETVLLFNLASRAPNNPVWMSGPSAVSSSAIGFSPKGKHFLYAAVGGLLGGSAGIQVVDAVHGQVELSQTTGPLPNEGWGFSPDGDRFLLVSAQGAVSNAALYDLSGQPNPNAAPIWSDSAAAGSVGYFFSPKGHYLLAAAVSAGNHTDLAIMDVSSRDHSRVYSSSFTFQTVPGSGQNTFGAAGWGFGPDDSRFVYSAVSGQASSSLTLVDLAARPATGSSVTLTAIVGAWWQFSPCGDVLGMVSQPNGSQVQVALYTTTLNAPAASQTFTLAPVQLKTTSASQVVTVGGTDVPLMPNQAAGRCGGGGGDGGSGGGGGGGGGTTGGGIHLPPPSLLTLEGLRIAPLLVSGGTTATGTVTTAGSQGLVTFASSNPQAAPAPADLTVTGNGAPTLDTTFSLTTRPVVQDTIVTITATAYNGRVTTTRSVDIIVAAPCPPAQTGALTQGPTGIGASAIRRGGSGGGPGAPSVSITITVAPIHVAGGESVQGTVTVDRRSRFVPITVQLASSSPVVQVPDSVTVPSGQDSVTFPITTQTISADTWATVAPDYAGANVDDGAAQLLVQAVPSLVSLTFDSASVAGGAASTGTVTLSSPALDCAPAVVQLSSDAPTVAAVPASVIVTAGAATGRFTVSTAAVQVDTTVRVTARFGTGSTWGSLTVKAQAPNTVANDNFANAAPLTLPGIASGDTTHATMEAGEPSLSGTCAVLTFHHVENSVWFKLTPAQSGILTVSTANPGTTFDSVLAVYADPGAAGAGGLAAPAGCDNNGDAIGFPALYSLEHTGPGPSDPGKPTWSSIMHANVTAGQTYYVQLGGVGGAPSGKFVLMAEVNPAVPVPGVLGDISLSAPAAAGGTAVTGTVTLSTPAPAGGVLVALSSSDPVAASAPASVVVPEGATTATFTVQAGTVNAATNVTITGSFDGRQRPANLTVMAP